MNASMLSLACVTPPHRATQIEAAQFAVDAAGLDGDPKRFAQTVYSRAGVAERASCMLGPGDLLQAFRSTPGRPHGPTTAERMAFYAQFAAELATQAAADALKRAEMTAESVTHLVTVSCTGFVAPGVDHALIERLGLARTVRRLHVGFMGCHGAINGLAAARAIALSEPSARVLVVCVELCSLHFQPTDRPDQIVANALFADGAAACVIAADRQEKGPCIEATGSCVLPDSADAMAWRIGDHGFEMTLRESVPGLIRQHLRPWLTAWLDGRGLSLSELVADGMWAVHPGGPRVLIAVGDALGLPSTALDASRRVLAEHGNMSSPTVLFILEQLRAAQRSSAGRGLLLAFGPGLSVEAALLGNIS